MALQVLPPELLQQIKIKLKPKNLSLIGPDSLKDGESEDFDFSAAMKQAMQSWVACLFEAAGPDGELKFNGYVVTHHPGTPSDLLVKLTGPNQIDQKLMAPTSSHAGF